MGMRPRNCIICNEKAGSREHIFPAALGGRRVNKKIYCETHNREFSPLAALLSRQLASINAMLGVRPDHSDKRHSFMVGGDNEQQGYLLSGINIKMAAPRVINDTFEQGIRSVQAHFSSEEQLQKWLADQRAAGFAVHSQKLAEGVRYFSKPYNVELIIGGEEGLRAIGYVGLTFLAHYFPLVARSESLETFRGYVTSRTSDQHVWWDFNNQMEEAGSETSMVEHRVTVGVSASTKQAYGRVSLFSTFDFGMVFGICNHTEDAEIVVNIAPQLERPDDLRDSRHQDSRSEVTRPEVAHSSLEYALTSGLLESRTSILLHKVMRWQTLQVVERVMPQLRSVDPTRIDIEFERVKLILGDGGQCIWNLVLRVATKLIQVYEAEPNTARAGSTIRFLTAEDESSQTGLSKSASYLLELIKGGLASHLCDQIRSGSLNSDGVFDLLSGREGSLIIGRILTDIVLRSLPA